MLSGGRSPCTPLSSTRVPSVRARVLRARPNGASGFPADRCECASSPLELFNPLERLVKLVLQLLGPLPHLDLVGRLVLQLLLAVLDFFLLLLDHHTRRVLFTL